MGNDWILPNLIITMIRTMIVFDVKTSRRIHYFITNSLYNTKSFMKLIIKNIDFYLCYQTAKALRQTEYHVTHL